MLIKQFKQKNFKNSNFPSISPALLSPPHFSLFSYEIIPFVNSFTSYRATIYLIKKYEYHLYIYIYIYINNHLCLQQNFGIISTFTHLFVYLYRLHFVLSSHLSLEFRLHMFFFHIVEQDFPHISLNFSLSSISSLGCVFEVTFQDFNLFTWVKFVFCASFELFFDWNFS